MAKSPFLILPLILLIIIANIANFYKEDIENIKDTLYWVIHRISLNPEVIEPLQKPSTRIETPTKTTTETPKTISTTPLRATHNEIPNPTLTAPQIIEWTNKERRNQGLDPLQENATLNLIATKKIEDMFRRQYFAHISPSSTSAGDIAREVGYEFISIGENLALGNFKNEEALVAAWMVSEGHRANILKPTYAEIGVAAKRSIFEGRLTWMSVQIFGIPQSLCPHPNELTRTYIEQHDASLTGLQETLEAQKEALLKEKETTEDRNAYSEKVREYNMLVNEYNNLIGETRKLIDTYNSETRAYNDCLSTYH